MTDQPVSNPYVGPRPFTQKDSGRFFGRDREARDLIPLVIAERLVLFYAQSGAGKSSLINARLIPGLRERNFLVLPVGRVSGEAAAQGDVANIYMHNLLVSLDPRRKQAGADLAKMTLPEFLANLEIEPTAEAKDAPNSGTAVPVDAPQVIEGVQPLALIIDQFEEILSTHPEAWKQRGPFFEQLCQALAADPYLWIILAIREDYVAALDPYAHLFPDRLRARFYMQRMEYNAALEAVKKPVADLRPFEDGVAEELVTSLRSIPVAEGKDEQLQMVESQYVEPVQLQVVCYQLWEQLKDEPGARITAADLARLARGGDLAQFISRSLAEFYEQAIQNVLKEPSVSINERKLREWFSRELITEAETRGSVFQGETKTGSLPNDVVSLLEKQFIVRSETRSSGKWYELSHDRFIAPILQANRAWNERHPRQVQADAEAWAKAGRQSKKLYEGRQLEAALQQLHDSPEDWNELEREFIQTSQAAADRQRTRRQGIGIGLLALLVIILVALTINSVIQSNKAQLNEARAITEGANVLAQKKTVERAVTEEANQANIAKTEKANADVQALLADGQRQTAIAYSQELATQSAAVEGARQTAVALGVVAEKERDNAEEARNQAQAGRLASIADNFRINNLDLSLLLSIEAVNLNDSWDTRGSLMSSVQRGLVNTLSRDGTQIYLGQKPYSTTFSPDGELVATGLIDGSVNVIYLNGRARLEGIPADFKSSFTVYTVAFSSDSQVLAQGNGGGSVVLWNRENNQIKRFFPFKTTFPYIFAIAFQPNGELLAIATQREQESGKGAVVLYNYKKDRVERTWDCGTYDCTSVAWSPDGKKLAVANKGGSFKVFDVELNREVRAVDRAHSDQIYALAWYPDSQRLVTGGLDRRLIQWDTKSGDELAESDRAETPVVISLAVSPNGGHYLLVGAGGVNEKQWASLWDADTLKRLAFPMYQHSQGVPAVAFNQQGNRFVTASYDTSLAIWRFEPVTALSSFIGSYKGGKLETISQDAAGNLLASQYTTGNQVNLISQATQTPLASFVVLHSSATAFRLDGKPVIGVGTYEGQMLFYDTSTGKTAHDPLKLANGSLRSLAATSGGELIAAAACKSSNQCGDIVIWDTQAGKALELSPALKELDLGIVSALAFSPDREQLAIGNDKGLIFFYNLKTGAVDQAVTEGLFLQNINLVVDSLAFGPDDSDVLIAGFNDGRVALWQASLRYPIGQFDERINGEVTALYAYYTSAGLKLAAASGRGDLRLYDIDIRSWQVLGCQLTGNHNLSPDERKKFLPDSDPNALTCPR